ncbi:cytochrome b5 [Violaceomyces palustris]|uniref:Cytochrome b5 n=1 Tax=Violaceomyces palustris TaxID=1673888 RepID=A0ACD0NPH5_9BASI|nr:cytochrome b5 [Violaceomyces palustris]
MTTERTKVTTLNQAQPEDLEDDTPPAFPSLNSAQRQSGGQNLRPGSTSKSPEDPGSSGSASWKKTSFLLPNPSTSLLAAPLPSSLAPSGGNLMLPPSTNSSTAPQGVGGASGASLGKDSKRKKVALAPGCSPLDWARLKNSTDLRGGVTSLLRVTPEELKRHNTRQDAWSAFSGKVYNITPYLKFHPGGEDELMRVAGRDGTRLFALTHSWVNIDAMIDTAMVGILVQG